jgi:hypothetical protein
MADMWDVTTPQFYNCWCSLVTALCTGCMGVLCHHRHAEVNFHFCPVDSIPIQQIWHWQGGCKNVERDIAALTIIPVLSTLTARKKRDHFWLEIQNLQAGGPFSAEGFFWLSRVQYWHAKSGPRKIPWTIFGKDHFWRDSSLAVIRIDALSLKYCRRPMSQAGLDPGGFRQGVRFS